MTPFIVSLHGWLVGIAMPSETSPFQHHRVTGFAIPAVDITMNHRLCRVELHGYIGMMGPLAPLLTSGLNTALLDPRLIDQAVGVTGALHDKLWWLGQSGIVQFRTFDAAAGLTMYQEEPGFYNERYRSPSFMGAVPDTVIQAVHRMARRTEECEAVVFEDSHLAKTLGQLQDLGLIDDSATFTVFDVRYLKELPDDE